MIAEWLYWEQPDSFCGSNCTHKNWNAWQSVSDGFAYLHCFPPPTLTHTRVPVLAPTYSNELCEHHKANITSTTMFYVNINTAICRAIAACYITSCKCNKRACQILRHTFSGFKLGCCKSNKGDSDAQPKLHCDTNYEKYNCTIK